MTMVVQSGGVLISYQFLIGDMERGVRKLIAREEHFTRRHAAFPDASVEAGRYDSKATGEMDPPSGLALLSLSLSSPIACSATGFLLLFLA